MITQVQEAITVEKRAVIVAPPGAGKTTIIPLKLLDNPNINGQIIILEPRRLAARAAASQMAAILNERIGETVGFKIKGLTKVSKQTRIVVMTEGILIRMIQSDPSLSEVGCIIFDEFHERSINSDLGLALSLQLSEILRSDKSSKNISLLLLILYPFGFNPIRDIAVIDFPLPDSPTIAVMLFFKIEKLRFFNI